MWFGEIRSCSCQTVLPGPSWVLLNYGCFADLISRPSSLDDIHVIDPEILYVGALTIVLLKTYSIMTSSTGPR